MAAKESGEKLIAQNKKARHFTNSWKCSKRDWS